MSDVDEKQRRKYRSMIARRCGWLMARLARTDLSDGAWEMTDLELEALVWCARAAGLDIESADLIRAELRAKRSMIEKAGGLATCRACDGTKRLGYVACPVCLSEDGASKET